MFDHAKPVARDIDPRQRLVSSKVPDWLTTLEPEHRQLMRQSSDQRDRQLEAACLANPDVAKALMSTYAEHLHAEAALKALLASVPALEPYATGVLTAALEQRFELKLDVSNTYLMNLSRAASLKTALGSPGDDPFATSARALQLATQSLLHSALQNFEASEAQPDGLKAGDQASCLLDSNDVSLLSTATPLAIAAEDFAALARELDLGGKYQLILDAVDPPAGHADAEAVREVFSAAERSAFKLQVHLALLRGKIDRFIHDTLLKLGSDEPVKLDGRTLLCGTIEVLQTPLTGAMTIGIDARIPSGGGRFPPGPTYPYDGWVVLYLPGMPEPLTQHGSRDEAEAFLTRQLPALKQPGAPGLLPDRDRSTFLGKLADTLEPYTWDETGQFKVRRPDVNARVRLHVHPFTKPRLEERTTQRQKRLRDDGLFHAVPTAAQDQQTAQRHLAYFEAIALNVLNFAGMFLPPLGAVMLGVTAVQLANEAFEGIDSWLDGDRQQALAYLMDVIDNLALMAALAGAGQGGERPVVEHIPVETPSFIEALKPVVLPDGEQRLWQPDLAPFAHDHVLPAGLAPDASGLIHHAGKTWLPVENRVYAINKSAAGYRLEHPTRTNAYQPEALHNGAGSWVLESEQPRTWDGPRLMRRMGHLSAQFDSLTLQQILDVCDIHEDVLRRALADNLRLPALLEDTLQRFGLHSAIEAANPHGSTAQLNAEFLRQYRSLPASQSPHADLITRIYPNLPTPIIDELLRQASASEVQALAQGKVPKRLGEEVRLYQQQIRLARAYEGLYLQAVHSEDTDLLMLYSVAQLPSMPQGLKIELHEGRFQPRLIASIGDDQAATVRLVTRYGSAYTSTAPFPAEPVAKQHATLAHALCDALNDPELATAPALLERLRQGPHLSRWMLRKQLGMQRASFRSPMRLADGRIGYRLSPTPWVDDLSLLDRFTRLYVRLTQIGVAPATANQLLSALQELPLSDEQADARLAQLADSAVTLQASLDQWRASPPAIADANFSSYSRDTLENALWTHWMHAAVPEFDAGHGTLYLNQTFLSEFPTDFPPGYGEGVRHLHLDNIAIDHAPAGNLPNARVRAVLENLFRHFPNVQMLEIDRPFAAEAPPFELQANLDLLVTYFTQLRELRLINQNLLLTPEAIDRLARMPRLDLLDLGGNLLAQGGEFVPSAWRLQYLGMERMSLMQWPQWLNADLMAQVAYLSLRENALVTVPGYLRLNPLSAGPGTVITLEANPLPEALVQHLAFSQDGLPRAFVFNLDLSAPIQANLATLQAQRIELRASLHQWALQGPASRVQTATDLSDFWEARVRQLGRAPLHLLDVRLEDFPPQLPAFYTEHVDHLILEGLDASRQQLDSCLRQFPRLVTLALYDNVQALHSVPQALVHLPSLTELELVGQGLVIDNATLELLLRLPALELLDLTGNRLSADLAAPVQVQRRLNQLTLADTGLEAWPAWLYDVMPTQLLDLGDNLLTHLPAEVLAANTLEGERTIVALAGNLLDDHARQLLGQAEGAPRLYLPHGFRPG